MRWEMAGVQNEEAANMNIVSDANLPRSSETDFQSKASAPGCPARLREALDSATSDFERLGLISYLRDSRGGRRTRGLSGGLSDAEFQGALKQLHLERFRDWLSHTTAQHLEDIRKYVFDPEDSRLAMNCLLITGKHAAPPEAEQHEIELFLHSLEVTQEVLKGMHRPLRRRPNMRCLQNGFRFWGDRTRGGQRANRVQPKNKRTPRRPLRSGWAKYAGT